MVEPLLASAFAAFGSENWTKFPVAPAARAARLLNVSVAGSTACCGAEFTFPSPPLNVSVLSAMLALARLPA